MALPYDNRDDITEATVQMYPIELEGAAGSLPAAEEVRTTIGNTHRKKFVYSKWALFCGTLAALVLLVIVIPAIALRGTSIMNNDSDNAIAPGLFYPTNHNAGKERVATQAQAIDFLVSMEVSSAAALNDTETPQYMAMEWLVKRDQANLFVPATTDDEDVRNQYIYRYILMVLYYAMDGISWRPSKMRFGTEYDICFWQYSQPVGTSGVVCWDKTKTPALLHLYDVGLSNRIPTEIAKMSSLVSISFENNRLTGSIPEELCELENIQNLFLNVNHLTGQIPSCLVGVTGLKHLFLDHNSLSKTIPDVLGDSQSLEIFSVSHNKLTGTIPSTLCQVPNITSLRLHSNELGREIPSCIGGLSELDSLILHNNKLTGSVPTSLQEATNLSVLVLSNNTLTGNPLSVVNRLTGLTHLLLDNNEFAGDIDETVLATNEKLVMTDISHNNFTSYEGFPTHMLELPNLLVLDLSKNALEGALPTEIATNSMLWFFAAYGNDLTGSLPQTLGNLNAMRHLDLSQNKFTGPIPDEIGEMTKLQLLFLSENPFEFGTIPSSLSALSNLKELSMRRTNREGALPEFLGSFEHLDMLDVSRNALTGSVPTSFGMLSQLGYLLLSDNGIGGSLPKELSGMKNVGQVYLDGTNLIGDVDVLCELPAFKELNGNEVIFADCDPSENGDASEVECGCECTCCPADAPEACSTPKLGILDGSIENWFQRATIDLGFNESIIHGKDDVLPKE